MVPVKFSIKTRSQSRSEPLSEQGESVEDQASGEGQFAQNAEEQLQETSSSESRGSIDSALRESGEEEELRHLASFEEEETVEEEQDMAEGGSTIRPPRFNGGIENNVEEYLAQFERVSKANGWNDAKKLVIVPCYLEGAALKWYENLEQKVGAALTWQEVKDQMKEAFQVVAWDDQLEYRLRMRMQGEDEAVESYVQEVTNLCSKVDPNMAERSKIKHVLRGLKPSLLEKVMLMENDTLENLMKNIRKVLTARFLAGQRVDHLMSDAPGTPIATTSSGQQGVPGPSATTKLESKLEELAAEFSRMSMRFLKQQDSARAPLRRDMGPPRERYQDGGRPPREDSYGNRRSEEDPRRERTRDHRVEDGRGRGGHGSYRRGGYGDRGRTSDGRVVCYKCNRVGHFAIACRSQDQGNGNRGR